MVVYTIGLLGRYILLLLSSLKHRNVFTSICSVFTVQFMSKRKNTVILHCVCFIELLCMHVQAVAQAGM
jgi:hypothetical protein